jgi:hypothetical protein
MTKLELSRYRTVSSTSSLPLTNSDTTAHDDDDDDDDDARSNDSLSTVDAELNTIHMKSCELESIPPPPPISATTTACSSIEPLLSSPSAPTQSKSYSNEMSAEDAHNASGTPYRRVQMPLRRSKSVPVGQASRVCDVTPIKPCFSQDMHSTQTPLRIVMQKVLSGKSDKFNDWGVSRRFCDESIRRLQDLHTRVRSNTTGSYIEIDSSCFNVRSPHALHRVHTTGSLDVPSNLLSLNSPLSMHDSNNIFRNSLMLSSPSTVSSSTRTSLTTATASHPYPQYNSINPLEFLKPFLPTMMRSPSHNIKHDDDHEKLTLAAELARQAIRTTLSATLNRYTSSISTPATGSILGANDTSAVDRKKSRKNKSISKWRRVSMGLNSSFNTSIFRNSASPVPIKSRTSLSASKYSPIYHMTSGNNNDYDEDMVIVQSPHISFASLSHHPSHEFECDVSSLHIENEIATSSSYCDTSSAQVQWNNSNLIVLSMEYLIANNSINTHRSNKKNTPQQSVNLNEIYVLRLVCKDWAIAYHRIIGKLLVDSSHIKPKQYDKWVDFMSMFNTGHYLTSGACKEVFQVTNKSLDMNQVLSIMDIVSLEEREMDYAVGQEIRIAYICSTLYDLNITPNLIKVYDVFQSIYTVSDDIWKKPKNQSRPYFSSLLSTNNSNNSTTIVLPKASNLVRGKYQYMHMEYCKGGDLESLVREKHVLTISIITNILFQMLYSLYACRDKLALRHFDIKLLNFFVTTGASLLTTTATTSATATSETKVPLSLLYSFGDRVFDIQLRHNEYDLVKLADFGTSVIGSRSIGEPIGVNQVQSAYSIPS